ncbi:hypothetical protein [Pleionea sp. CnH1-48]|uniref:hypothetical protein n=1 Tax=Pleionea sp. CnH1-48 TaxID=2954494 RepID=UPI0020983485|nr:hypothetical protein [Pleionea sp. CnH1-48]MCO7223350.1 hypothetical protein [Pleionea sp. CnH1-48]
MNTNRSNNKARKLGMSKLPGKAMEKSAKALYEHFSGLKLGVFDSVALALSMATDCRYAGVGRYNGKAGVRVMSFCDNARIIKDPIEYELANTPCEKVAEASSSCYFRKVRATFPDDEMLFELGVDDYAGCNYYSPEGEKLGHLFIMSNRLIGNYTDVQSTLEYMCLLAEVELAEQIALH